MGKREVTEGTVRVMIDGEMFTTGIVEFSAVDGRAMAELL